MQGETERIFKLSNHPGSLGLSCLRDGLALAGVPLLRNADNDFTPRPQREVRRLLDRAYGPGTVSDSVMAGIGNVARALSAGDVGLAQTAAVLLKLPELDWDGAVRIAQAEDSLRKYDPDEPRDWRGRWTTGGGDDGAQPGVELLSGHATDEVVDLAAEAMQGANNSDAQQSSNPFPLPHGWVSLPPGKRIDELGDLLEWIANAKPSDAPAIANEIDRQFTQNGDLNGAVKLMGALLKIAETDPTTEDRQKVLDDYDYLTKVDPREAGQKTIDTIAMLGNLGMLGSLGLPNAKQPVGSEGLTPDPAKPSAAWGLGSAARGDFFSAALGANLSRTFP